MNITCKFDANILKINGFIAFLLKRYRRGQFTARTLYIYQPKFLLCHPADYSILTVFIYRNIEYNCFAHWGKGWDAS